jgi:hypothetical protein
MREVKAAKLILVSLLTLSLALTLTSYSSAFPTRAETYHVRCSNCHGLKNIAAVLKGPKKVTPGQAFTISAYLDGQAEKLIVEDLYRSADRSKALAELDVEIRQAGYDGLYDYLKSKNRHYKANGNGKLKSGALLVIPKEFEGLLSLTKGPSKEKVFNFRLQAPREPGTYLLFLEASMGKPNSPHGGTGTASFAIQVE